MNSKLFSIDLSDVGKAGLLAAGTFLTPLVPILVSMSLPSLAQTETALMAGLKVGVLYLMKNFFTNSDGRFARAEIKK